MEERWKSGDVSIEMDTSAEHLLFTALIQLFQTDLKASSKQVNSMEKIVDVRVDDKWVSRAVEFMRSFFASEEEFKQFGLRGLRSTLMLLSMY
jgi:hypothetical protein